MLLCERGRNDDEGVGECVHVQRATCSARSDMQRRQRQLSWGSAVSYAVATDGSGAPTEEEQVMSATARKHLGEAHASDAVPEGREPPLRTRTAKTHPRGAERLRVARARTHADRGGSAASHDWQLETEKTPPAHATPTRTLPRAAGQLAPLERAAIHTIGTHSTPRLPPDTSLRWLPLAG